MDYTKYIDVKFVPLPELNGNMKWYEGFVKYFQDIIIKWNFVELADDIDGRTRAKELIQYISDRYEQGKFEPVFMVIQPDVNIDEAFGLFKSSSAAVSSSTFKYLMGTSENNDYVYYADLSGIYITGLKYDARVTFDTPYDNVVSFLGTAWRSIKNFVTSNVWWVVGIVILIVCFPLVILLVKVLLNLIISLFNWLTKKLT